MVANIRIARTDRRGYAFLQRPTSLHLHETAVRALLPAVLSNTRRPVAVEGYVVRAAALRPVQWVTTRNGEWPGRERCTPG